MYFFISKNKTKRMGCSPSEMSDEEEIRKKKYPRIIKRECDIQLKKIEKVDNNYDRMTSNTSFDGGEGMPTTKDNERIKEIERKLERLTIQVENQNITTEELKKRENIIVRQIKDQNIKIEENQKLTQDAMYVIVEKLTKHDKKLTSNSRDFEILNNTAKELITTVKEFHPPASDRKAKITKKIKEVERQLDKYRCPISHEIMKDPVLAKDGHTYERSKILEWIQRDQTSPFTRENLQIKEIFPNLAVKDEICELNAKLVKLNSKLRTIEDNITP